MEALITIGIFAGIMLLLWGGSYYVVKVRTPRRNRPKILAALDEAERFGWSDIDSNMKAASKRWRHLRTGHDDAELYRLEPYRDRIAIQLDVIQPREAELKKYWLKSNGASIDIPVVNI
ncbi:hypothetical protein [Pseudarthrobacter sulfonivorans]|jgi:hypothetical protein|uniref:hypothetical protein n=1 Tax=Pseudarthrobacter sulfonivorans TaxID=121292 RepID=UPI002865152B|nr:hypothetical protein [Pseudarthrobacter sulfonivorans]MDR6414097.1 hypothetical protein [Pseudarthrobacter sulfonivorans]